MTVSPVRDDNLRLVLAPVEKQKIDELQRKAKWKVVFGVALIAVVALAFALPFFVHLGEINEMSWFVRLPYYLVFLVAFPGFFAAPMVLISAAGDAVKAQRYRDEFESFQHSYGRDPDAVQTPKSWTVE